MRLIEAATGRPRGRPDWQGFGRAVEFRKDKAAGQDPGEIIAVVRRVLSENGREYLPQYLFAIGCLLAIAATTAFSAWIMRDVVDEIFYRRRADLIAVICGAIVVTFVIRGVAIYGQAVVLAKIGNNLVARYQQRLFDHLMKLGVGFFSETRSAHLAAQINQNVNGIRDLLGLTITSVARDVVSLLALVGVMVWQDWILSVIALLIGPPLVYTVNYLMRRLQAHHARIGGSEFAADRRHAGGDARHHHRQGLHHGGRAFRKAGGADRPCRAPGQQDRARLRAAVADRRNAGRLRRCRRHRLCRLSRALRQRSRPARCSPSSRRCCSPTTRPAGWRARRSRSSARWSMPA